MSLIVEVPIDLISPHRNFTAGMNLLVIAAIANTLRNGADGGYGPCQTAPIVLSRDGAERFRIEDGRHRWTAHWLAGLQTARCLILDDQPTD
jgi:hypothetical protein